MKARHLAAVLPLLAAACAKPEPAAQDSQETASPAPAPLSSSSPAPAENSYRYTTLANCRVVRESRDEAGFVEEECPGVGGYRLQVTESDLRQNIAVIAPDGTATSLDLSVIGGGGFSALGPTAEWRGPGAGGDSLSPQAIVFRYQVVEQPESDKEVSYLLAARLAPTPCVVARIPPGPGQNETARRLADGGGACLKP